MLLGLTLSSTAQAATYTLSGTSGTVNIAGVNCTISGSSVSCPSSLTFGNGDNLTAASSYSLSISGTLNLSNNACVGYGSACSSQTSAINVTVTGSININNNAKVFGNLTATNGTVTLGNSSNTQVYGNVVANTISAGNNAQVFGSCIPNNAVCTSPTTCLTDTFSTGTLDTSLWNVSGNTYTPQVVTSPTVSSNRLRLTDNAGNRATFAQFKRWFPGANNKVVVEFDYFGWGGSGADGVAVVLSDASIPPTPGGYGGSLGYANRSGVDGFGGGWLGIGLDEFGNYPGTGEGRRGYPSGYTPPTGAAVAAGTAANSITVRGSGSGQASGYVLLANAGTLTPAIKTGTSSTDSTTKHRYRVTIDNSNSVNAYVQVERDTTGSGSSYTTVIPAFDVRVASAGQAAVPVNLMLSFTGSTGGATNNHEIANVRVCATTMNPVGSSAAAANFECMDGYLSQSSYNNRQTTPAARNPIYTKLARTAFNLRVVPLGSDGSVKTDYIVAGGSSKAVTVEFFDASGSAPASCSAWSASNLVATQTTTLASGVDFLTSNFTVNKAYPKLMCRVTDNTSGSPVYGCSSDQFVVRPGSVTLSTIPTMATPPSAAATPVTKAGAAFTLRASTSTSTSDAYSGTLSQVNSLLTAQTTVQASTQAAGGVVGALSPGSLTANATPTSNASYREVGYLYLAAGAYQDTTYTAVDSGVSGTPDCVAGSTSIALSSGKYGCVVGTTAATSLGRFIPDRFAITPAAPVAACTTHPAAGGSYTPTDFSYFGQDGFSTPFTVTAQNTAGATTANYAGVFAKLGLTTYANYAFAATGLPAGATLATSTAAPSGTWGPGVASVVAKHQVSRPTNLADQTLVTLTTLPMDSDNVTLAGSTAAAVSSSATALRYGRVGLQNAYGSDMLALSVPVQAQYRSGGNWVANTDDSCTALALPAAVTLATGAVPPGTPGRYYYPVVTGRNEITASNPAVSLSSSTLVGGTARINLAKPSKTGWLDIILSVDPYLLGSWGNCFGQTGTLGLQDDFPCARASFGLYKSPLIYRRENY